MGNDLALSVAPRTGGADSEKTLALDHLSPAAAGWAVFGTRAGFKTVSLTMGTGFHPRNFNFHLLPLGRFHKGNRKIVTKVRSLPGSGLSSPASLPEAKKVFKNIPETGKNIFKTAEAAETGALQSFMAEPIIEIPLLRIMQNLIGLGCFFKPFLSPFISWIPVRVVLKGHFTVGLFNFFFIGLP
jgi:hypothetical protein